MSEPLPDVLTEDERDLLVQGLVQWGGPAACTDELAVAMGFAGIRRFYVEADRLRDAVRAGVALSYEDWRRVLLATEIVFVSDVVGAGVDWSTCTGFTDAETIGLLRSVQRKMPRWRGSVQFSFGAEGEVVISDPERPRPDV